jgi:hypothetical protein
VDLEGEKPQYYIVPELRMRRDILKRHNAWLDTQPDRQRPLTQDSEHSATSVENVQE